ncbi:MAG: iron-sulfur cluster repair di-iron protein [Acidimicrobiales bacterium]
MSDDRIDAPLGALVDGTASAAVLDRFGLDYCCGGGRTLADACAPLGLHPADVLDALDALAVDGGGDPGGEAWASMGPAELVDHLEATHHAWLRGSLDRALPLADKVAGVHGERHPELAEVQRLVHELADDLLPHLQKEERILFPMIRELATAEQSPEFHCGSLRNPIRVMGMEHDRAGELLAELRAATGGYEVPADGCASYRLLYEELTALEADTHLHVHKENNVLFPAVVAMEDRLARSA